MCTAHLSSKTISMTAEEIEQAFNNMSALEDFTLINYEAHGIGGSHNNNRGRKMYRIQTGGAGPTVISPVQQSLIQAKKVVGIKRKRSRSRSHSSRRRSTSRSSSILGRGGKKKKKRRRKRSRKTGPRKKKAAAASSGGKKKSKKRRWSKKLRDIFSV